MGQREDRPGQFIGLLAAATDLGCAPQTLRKRVRSGDLPVFSNPLDRRCRLVRIADLDRLRQPRPIRPNMAELDFDGAA